MKLPLVNKVRKSYTYGIVPPLAMGRSTAGLIVLACP